MLLKILRAHRTTSEINSLLIENRTSKRYVDYSSGDTPLPVLEPVKVWLYPRRIQRHWSATPRCVRGSTCNASSRVRKSISGLLDLRTSKYATGNSIILENLSKHFKRNTMLGSQPQPDMLSILLSGNEKTLREEFMTSIPISIDEAANPHAEPFLRVPGFPLSDNKPPSGEYGRPIKNQKYFRFYAFTTGQNSRPGAPLGSLFLFSGDFVPFV